MTAEHKKYSLTTAAYYDSIAERYAEGSAAVVVTEQIDQFIDSLPARARVLDLACGPGHDTNYLKAKGLAATGADLSANMLSLAQSLAGGGFTLMDFFNLGFDLEAFEGVWASSAIVHIKREDLSVFLAEVTRVLKPNGVFGIITAQRSQGDPERNPDDPREYSMYGLNELQSYLETSGFEVQKASSFKYGGKNNDKDRIFIIARKRNNE